MGNRSLLSAERDELEQILDRHSLSAVLDAFEQICYEKAEHLESNWQDRRGGAVWTRVGKKIGALGRTKAVKDLP